MLTWIVIGAAAITPGDSAAHAAATKKLLLLIFNCGFSNFL
jgi:hypothetical protein